MGSLKYRQRRNIAGDWVRKLRDPTRTIQRVAKSVVLVMMLTFSSRRRKEAFYLRL